MSSFAESEAVFKDLVASAGLDETIYKALSDSGFKTLSKFAFSSSYTPGAVDESAFVKTVKELASFPKRFMGSRSVGFRSASILFKCFNVN